MSGSEAAAGAARPQPSALLALRITAPGWLFGLRFWLAVSLALYLAFWLQLANPYWAATSAGFICQPSLGASLRKSWFRMIGTLVGTVMAVVLTACFPQNRAAFLLGLALWAGLCGMAGTFLRNFASYASVLAGLTTAIIAMDELGQTGGAAGNEVFQLAVARCVEIWLGIVSAGLVLAGTDFGTARRRLGNQFAAITAEIAGRVAVTLARGAPAPGDEELDARRELIRRVAALDSVIDEAIGEVSDLRYRLRILQAAVDGLFIALSSWQSIANHLLLRSEGAETAKLLRLIPPELQFAWTRGDAKTWTEDPFRLVEACRTAVRDLLSFPSDTPSSRLLADRAAVVMLGLHDALRGLAVLCQPMAAAPQHRAAHLRVPDVLPGLMNGLRAFLTVCVAGSAWIVTAWPNGATAMVFATIGVLLFSLRDEQAYAAALQFTIGLFLASVLAGVIKFGLLVHMTAFLGLSAALGLVLVPAAALSTGSWRGPVFNAIALFLVPLLGPTNVMVYDFSAFLNSSIAIVGGMMGSLLVLMLFPPLRPAFRAERLVALTLRDLRRLAVRPLSRTPQDWQSQVFGRLAAMPEAAVPIQRAWLMAALSLGTEIIRIRRIGGRFGLAAGTDEAFQALARGDCDEVIAGLRRVDAAAAEANDPARLRLRAAMLGSIEKLKRYGDFFGASPS